MDGKAGQTARWAGIKPLGAALAWGAGARRALFALGTLAALTLVSAVGFGVPEWLTVVIAQTVGAEGLLPPPNLPFQRAPSSQWPQEWGVLPASVRAPLGASGHVARLRDLRLRPPLAVEGATLQAHGPAPLTLATTRLVLRDATLITDGADLLIEVETLDVRNSVLRAFPAGGRAGSGDGRGGGRVRIVVHGKAEGVLRVDLTGEGGAAGAAGAAGAKGTEGAKGPPARSVNNECQAPAGPGGRGGPGEPGGDGANGANGGPGGALELAGADPKRLAEHIEFKAEGGSAGPAGPAGPGGAGGPGGLGGDPAGVCFGNGPRGVAGPMGRPGQPGRAGASGREGAMRSAG